MEYTKLGNSGLDVSRLCLGCMGFGVKERWMYPWVIDEESSRTVIKKALELGINFFTHPHLSLPLVLEGLQ